MRKGKNIKTYKTSSLNAGKLSSHWNSSSFSYELIHYCYWHYQGSQSTASEGQMCVWEKKNQRGTQRSVMDLAVPAFTQGKAESYQMFNFSPINYFCKTLCFTYAYTHVSRLRVCDVYACMWSQTPRLELQVVLSGPVWTQVVWENSQVFSLCNLTVSFYVILAVLDFAT